MELEGRWEYDNVQLRLGEDYTVMSDHCSISWISVWEIWLKFISTILYLFSDYFWIRMWDFIFVLLNVTASIWWDYLKFWFLLCFMLAVSSNFVSLINVGKYLCGYELIWVTEKEYSEQC